MQKTEIVTDEVLARWENWLETSPTAICGSDPTSPAGLMVPTLVRSLREARRRIAALEALLEQASDERVLR